MESFINPNVAYMLLIGGALFTFMALIAPGTGVLELLAFVFLMAAGWAMYNLTINPWMLILLLLGVIPFILSLRKSLPRERRRLLLGIAVGIFIIGTIFLFPRDLWWQPAVNLLLAGMVSVLAGSYLWIVATRGMEAEQSLPTHDLGALVGQVGEAKTEISQEGSVQVAGELWSARSKTPIVVGSTVKVIGREGFILEVEAVSRESQ
jgi:membrane-bound serine protease (ClpP class)